MERYKLNQRPELIPIPTKNEYWGQTAKYLPYERERRIGKSWVIIQKNDNDRVGFFLENRFTGEQVAHTKSDAGIEGWNEINERFEFFENRPPEYRTQQQQQQPGPGPQHEPIPGLLTDSQEKFYQFFDKETAKMEASFAELDEKLKKRNAEIDAELARQKMQTLKESLADLEQQMAKIAPVPDPEKTEGNDTQSPDPDA